MVVGEDMGGMVGSVFISVVEVVVRWVGGGERENRKKMFYLF